MKNECYNTLLYTPDPALVARLVGFVLVVASAPVVAVAAVVVGDIFQLLHEALPVLGRE